MGFKNASGQEVDFTVPDEATSDNGGATPPTVEIADPSSGSIDVDVLRAILDGSGKRYIDVMYRAAPGATIDWLRVMDGTGNPDVKVGGNAPGAGSPRLLSDAKPIGMVSVTTTAGLTLVPLLLEDRVISGTTYRQAYYLNGTTKVYVVNTKDLPGASDDALLAAAMRITGTTRVRYLLGTDPLPIGVVSVTFGAGDFKNADTTSVTGAGNVDTTLSFTVTGTTVVVTDPGNGGSIDVNVLNNRDWIDVIYTLPTGGQVIDRRSIVDLAAEFGLSGPGLGSIVLDPARAPYLRLGQLDRR